MPICIGLLEILLFELERYYCTQPYLCTLCKAMFTLAYYGMLRIGEIALGTHTIKAKDIHIGSNKNKILRLLYSSKIKINESTVINFKRKCIFCPFMLLREYFRVWQPYLHDYELLFVFRDNSPVKPNSSQISSTQLIKES